MTSSSDQRGALNTVTVVRLVAARELRERLRAKSFYVFSAILVAVIVGIGVLSRLAGDDGADALAVGVAGSAPHDLQEAVDQAAETFERGAEVVTYDDAGSAEAALEDGDVDVAVIPEEHRVVFDDEVDDEALVIVQQAWSGAEVRSALAEAGLTPQQTSEALAVAPLEASTLDGDGDGEGLGMLTGTLAAILLFISLQTFGGYVLTGVVEEKSTAVIELLLVRARGEQMLAGKVIGIGAAALLQFALAVAAGLASLAVSGTEVPTEIWAATPMTLVWFLGGYALYSTLFALAGSLVSRQEDAQAASTPILTVLLAAYMLVFFFGYVPDSTASTVMSLVPPLAPLLMPMRMAAGAASVIEVVVALALLGGAVLLAWRMTGRIYEQVLLHRGTRISWRDAAALLRRPAGAR